MKSNKNLDIYELQKPRGYNAIGSVYRPNYNYHHLGLQRPRNYDNLRVRMDEYDRDNL